MTSPLVSVIVPAYNVKEHIARCIDSVLAQTGVEFELLVVDDGSTDGTADRIKELAEKDARIRPFFKENGGVSAARNDALDAIRGAYFVFLDSDDALEAGALSELLLLQQEHPGSFIATERMLVATDDEGKETRKERRPGAVRQELTQREALLDLCEGRYCLQSVCHKLFSAETAGELRFDPAIAHGEDRLFVYEYLKRVDKLYYAPSPLWEVYSRAGSASRSPLNMKWMGMIEVMDRMIAEETDEEVRSFFMQKRLELLSLYLAAYVSRHSSDEAFWQALRTRTRKELKQAGSCGISAKERMAARMYAYLPKGLIALYLKLKGKKI